MCYMVETEWDVNDCFVVKANNREFTFDMSNGRAELSFVRTMFRMSDEVTDEYQSVSDLPESVVEAVEAEGYSVSF